MIPDKLVVAAARAVHPHFDKFSDTTKAAAMADARDALAAAFAVLPECEEVQPPLWKLPDARLGWTDCLAALARRGNNGNS